MADRIQYFIIAPVLGTTPGSRDSGSRYPGPTRGTFEKSSTVSITGVLRWSGLRTVIHDFPCPITSLPQGLLWATFAPKKQSDDEEKPWRALLLLLGRGAWIPNHRPRPSSQLTDQRAPYARQKATLITILPISLSPDPVCWNTHHSHFATNIPHASCAMRLGTIGLFQYH